jgi:hypothetical protein
VAVEPSKVVTAQEVAVEATGVVTVEATGVVTVEATGVLTNLEVRRQEMIV